MKNSTTVRSAVGKPAELLIYVVDSSDESSTMAGSFAEARVEWSTDVAAALDLADRWRPDVVVLRVPCDELRRADALQHLHAVAPGCRVVVLPLRSVADCRDECGEPAGNGRGDGTYFVQSTKLPPDAETAVRVQTLRPRAESAGLARQIVRSACADVDADAEKLCNDALLVGTELVTNAVTHAHSAVGLTVRAWPGVIRIEVRDRVSELPVLRLADGSARGGRGLTLIDALCSAWGIDPSVKGKTVWGQLGSPRLVSTH